MAKWKAAGRMTAVMRDAEKQAQLRRMQREMFQESIHNGKVLRMLARKRADTGKRSTYVISRYDRMSQLANHEYTNCSDDLSVAKSNYHQRRDDMNNEALISNIERLDLAREERRKTQEALGILRVKMQQLDRELFDAKKKLKKITVDCENVRVDSADKVVRRVEQVEHKLGVQLVENQRLKDNVDHLQGERDKLKRVHSALDKDLAQLSKTLVACIEQSRDSYDARDQTHRGIGKLNELLKRNTFSYESEMGLLQFRIDCLRRMERFMTTKNKFRPDFDRTRRHEYLTQPTTAERDNICYRQMMAEMAADLDGADLHRTIEIFIELEQENYMLFKNISETREACHTLQVNMEEAHAQYKKLLKDNQNDGQETMARKVELMEKIQTCRQQADRSEEHIAAADEVIGVYIEGVLSIMDKMGYNEGDIERISGIFSDVEERNVHVFLSEIERYINQMFDLKAAADYMAWNEARSTSVPEPLPPRLPLVRRLQVVPPEHEEGDDLDDPILPVEASFRPLEGTEMLHHIEENLESQAVVELEEYNYLPSPTMADATSELIGDYPQPQQNHCKASGKKKF